MKFKIVLVLICILSIPDGAQGFSLNGFALKHSYARLYPRDIEKLDFPEKNGISGSSETKPLEAVRQLEYRPRGGPDRDDALVILQSRRTEEDSEDFNRYENDHGFKSLPPNLKEYVSGMMYQNHQQSPFVVIITGLPRRSRCHLCLRVREALSER